MTTNKKSQITKADYDTSYTDNGRKTKTNKIIVINRSTTRRDIQQNIIVSTDTPNKT